MVCAVKMKGKEEKLIFAKYMLMSSTNNRRCHHGLH